MGDLLEYTWGTRELSVLDPFAGGGSIPFEALRYGFTTIANDLNPVAAVILKATLDYPARFGPSLADDIRKWGNEWAKRVKEKLETYFPKQPNESIFAYLWARIVACPATGKPVPLSPNWWLRTGSNPVAVKLIAAEDANEPRFEIVTGKQAALANPDTGTIARGVGRSPWTGETISGDYIKAEAQAGRMGQILYAVAIKKPGGFEFRAPTPEDIEAVRCAEVSLQKLIPVWSAQGLLVSEPIPDGNKTSEPHRYGEMYWSQAFAPRQLCALTVFLECLKLVQADMAGITDPDRRSAIETYLGLALDKAVIYNNHHCRFDPGRGIRSVFDRHDYAFVWSHAEFDASGNLLPWVINQVVDAYAELAKYLSPQQTVLGSNPVTSGLKQVITYVGSASTLVHIPDNSIHNITVDPPYSDNVMYAELADFFYVWLKRSVGYLFPDFFRDELTNKDDEAVANPARFESMGRKKKELAEHDYQLKMAAAFREMHRVLRPDGSLTVMFTHKRVEAWDTLASALIGAGFTIKASWPVHTESEHSLHQAKKNAASSTILLVCRKRHGEGEKGRSGEQTTWWDDLKPVVRRTAREVAEKFAAQGISGADLYISTFGPTLSIISEHWPVLTSETDPKTGQPKPLRPEVALDLAREEVVRLRKQGLLLGRDVQFDPVTDWYLMAWDSYGAEQFPYDEARKLAIALGLDLEHTLMQSEHLITKKGEYVVLQAPALRRRKGMVDDTLTSFEYLVDAVHTAMMVYDEDGPGACDVFLRNAGLKNDGTFKACLQALINAIPRSRVKGKFVRPEAETLENMRLAFFDDLQAPVEPEPPVLPAKQIGLGEGFEVESGEEEEDAEE
jgi:adenine-specific DNA methylase